MSLEVEINLTDFDLQLQKSVFFIQHIKCLIVAQGSKDNNRTETMHGNKGIEVKNLRDDIR